MFAVDNDPDSLPPCRLLHVVPGGDYGYKYRNGRKGTHPFTAWNGEVPGTLPMVTGVGEAPAGVIVCGNTATRFPDKLPADYRGDLLVTSWGDHRIERYQLKPRGASFSAERINVVVGDENFRPVDLVVGGDGAVYFTDWVDKSYNLHKKGRIWRLSAVNPLLRGEGRVRVLQPMPLSPVPTALSPGERRELRSGAPKPRRNSGPMRCGTLTRRSIPKRPLRCGPPVTIPTRLFSRLPVKD